MPLYQFLHRKNFWNKLVMSNRHKQQCLLQASKDDIQGEVNRCSIKINFNGESDYKRLFSDS